MVIYHQGGIFIKYLISIDVGGTFIKYGLLDNTGKIYHQGKIESKRQLIHVYNKTRN